MNTASDDLGRWIEARVVAHEGRTPLARLHNDFALWSLKNNAAYIRREAFQTLLPLSVEGVTLEGAMVRGVCLREDLPREKPVAQEEAPLSITAAQLLEDLLEAGPRSTRDIRAASSQAGFAWATMLMVKARLNVHSPIAGIWSPPGFFLAQCQQQAVAAAERLKREGKIVSLERRSGGRVAVGWYV